MISAAASTGQVRLPRVSGLLYMHTNQSIGSVWMTHLTATPEILIPCQALRFNPLALGSHSGRPYRRIPTPILWQSRRDRVVECPVLPQSRGYALGRAC